MTRYYFSERVWLQSAFLLLAAIPAILIAFQFDARMINDIPIWVKPLKFHVSTSLHLITLAVLVQFLSKDTRTSIWLGAVAVISAVAAVIELLIISGQAVRGVPSHFNFATSFDAIVYAMMGVGALLLIMPALVLGLRFLTAPVSEKLSPGLKLGAGLGLTIGFILTLVLAGYMSMRSGGHWVGGPQTDEGGVPIVGWSRQGGDLRVSHFIATHLMQVLPLVGYLGDKLFGVDSATPKRIVWIAAISGTALTIATFMQALAGQPFVRF